MCSPVSGHGTGLRNDETCSWIAAPNRRLTLNPRAVLQAECGNTTWFPGAVVLPTTTPFVGASFFVGSRTASMRHMSFAGPTSSQRYHPAAVAADRYQAIYMIAGVVQHELRGRLRLVYRRPFTATFRPDACNHSRNAQGELSPWCRASGQPRVASRGACQQPARVPAMALADRAMKGDHECFRPLLQNSTLILARTLTGGLQLGRCVESASSYFLRFLRTLWYHDRESSRSHGLSITRVSHCTCPPPPGIPRSAEKVGPSCLGTNGTSVANDRSVEYALICLVVQHGWQSRARGSHPHGHSVSTTPGVAVEALMHGIGTRLIAQTYVRRTGMELACVQNHPLVFVRLYVALPFGARRPRGISTRPPRACALSLDSRCRGVNIKTGGSSPLPFWLFVGLHEQA